MAIPAHEPTQYQSRLKQAREAAGMTCQELGELLGMSRQSVSQFENGRQSMDVAKFLLACDALGVRMEWVVYGTGPQRRSDAPAPVKPAKRPAVRTRERAGKAGPAAANRAS